MELNEYQKVAQERILNFLDNDNEKMLLVEGEGGSGKSFLFSYMISNLLKNDPDNNMYFFILTYTNSAKKELKKKFKERNIIDIKFYENNLQFLTIHSACNSRKKYNKNGDFRFERLRYYKSKIYNQYNDLKKSGHLKSKIIVLVDECSIINFEQFNVFRDLCEECNIKCIFTGDSSQLPHIEDEYFIKEKHTAIDIIKKNLYKYNTKKIDINKITDTLGKYIIYEDENTSPVFKYVKNYFYINGNMRITNKNIGGIINYTRKCNIQKHFFDDKHFNSFLNDSVYKMDLIDFNNSINNTDIYDPDNDIVLTYRNKERDRLNKIIREKLFGNLKEYFFYKYMINENVIVHKQFYIADYGEDIKFITNEMHKVESVKFYVNHKAIIFDIFTFPCVIQIFRFKDLPIDIYQLENIYIKKFKKFIWIIKHLLLNEYIEETENIKSKKKKQCILCNKYNTMCNCHGDIYYCEKCKDTFFDYLDEKLEEYNNNIDRLLNVMYESIDYFNDRYNPPLIYPYTMTTYRSQGMTFKKVFVAMNDINKLKNNSVLYNKYLYVALSRASHEIVLLYDLF